MTDDSRQKQYWEADHSFRDYKHPIVEFFAKQRISYLQKHIDFTSISNALDVGCGSGFSTYYMKKYINNIIAIDRSKTMLKRHPLNNSGSLSIGDTYFLPFKDNSFDLVYAWEVLHHQSEPEKTISEMRRVSRKYILIAEPNPINIIQFLFSLCDKDHRWILKFKKKYINHLFKYNDLNIIKCFSGGWIFPNKTPVWLYYILKLLPYSSFIGITNWIIGEKNKS